MVNETREIYNVEQIKTLIVYGETLDPSNAQLAIRMLKRITTAVTLR